MVGVIRLDACECPLSEADPPVLAGSPNCRRRAMSVLDSDSTTLATIIEDPGFDEAQVAAAAFLARYNARSMPIATTCGPSFNGPPTQA
jgi:hypothetical protein